MTSIQSSQSSELNQEAGLDDYVRSLYQALQSGQGDASARYGFQVGTLHLLIKPEVVSELLDLSIVYPLPNTPDWFQGLMNLRGNLVPVFELSGLLGTTRDPQARSYTLVLDADQKAVAVHLCQLPSILRQLEPLSVTPSMTTVFQPYISQAYTDHQATWLEFEHRAFFTALNKGEIQSPGVSA